MKSTIKILKDIAKNAPHQQQAITWSDLHAMLSKADIMEGQLKANLEKVRKGQEEAKRDHDKEINKYNANRQG